MQKQSSTKRAWFHLRNCARFFFFLFVLTGPLKAQHDSSYTVQLSAGSSYFDMFRQRSNNSRTIVFSKESFANLSAVSEKESISVSFRAFEQYASLNQYRTKFIFSTSHALQTAGIRYANTFSFADYTLEFAVPLNTPKNRLQYGISIGVDPFEGLLDAEISLRRTPMHYTTSLVFQDFAVPFRDIPPVTTASYVIRSRPFSDLRTEINYSEADSKDGGATNLYGLIFDFHSFGKKFAVEYTLMNSSVISAEVETEEYRTELIFNKNNLSFGDFENGWGKFSRYKAGIHFAAFNLPVSIQYSFAQLSVAGLGEIESWPFTSLAASIITNRLNYQLSGTIKHHSMTVSGVHQFETSSLSAALSYHRILPDAVIEHWEPEFLVFGRKNFTQTPFSISDIHLVGAGLHYLVPFDRFTASLYFDQYIPLSITYKKSITGVSPPPGAPSAPSSTPSTDGGRRAGILFSYKL